MSIILITENFFFTPRCYFSMLRDTRTMNCWNSTVCSIARLVSRWGGGNKWNSVLLGESIRWLFDYFSVSLLYIWKLRWTFSIEKQFRAKLIKCCAKLFKNHKMYLIKATKNEKCINNAWLKEDRNDFFFHIKHIVYFNNVHMIWL